MSLLDGTVLEWVVAMVDSDASIDEVRRLHDGRSPWMLRVVHGGQERTVVLRVGDTADRASLRTQVAGLRVAASHGIDVPRLVAADVDRDPPVVLTEAIAGHRTIPRKRPVARLRPLGALVAALHRIPPPADPDLPRRDRPIALVDFAHLRRSQPTSSLLVHAEQPVEACQPASVDGFVHGDLWQGNVLWDGDELVSVVDWDCARVGPAGVDLPRGCQVRRVFVGDRVPVGTEGVDSVADVGRGLQPGVGDQGEAQRLVDLVVEVTAPDVALVDEEQIATQGVRALALVQLLA